MTTWFVSDTHFCHANIIKYSNRPFTNVSEMNENMIIAWNKVVAPTDNVWHLGDFGFGSAVQIEKIVEQLNGFKNLILGNHDQEIIRNEKRFTCRALFNSISRYAEFRHGNEFIVLLHYGMRVWNRSHRGSIQLYGHSHGSLTPCGKSVDVGVDAPFVIPRTTRLDYRPVSMEEVLAFMKNRAISVVDHHKEKL